jgi:transposase
MGEQYVGIDLHRRRSVIMRMTPAGEVLEMVRVDNDPVALSLELAKAGPDPEVVLEATYGWYWAADLLQACGARVHLAHPLGIKMFGYQRVKTDARDSTNLAELLRMGRLPEAWLAPPAVRELRELIRYRAKLVALRSGLKAQVHAVLAKQGVRVPMSDLFGVAGSRLLDQLQLGRAYGLWVASLRTLLVAYDQEIAMLGREIAAALAGDIGYLALQAIPGVGPVLAAVFVAEIGDVGRFAGAPQLCSWAGLTPRHRESDTTVRRGPITKQGPPAGPLGRGRGHPAAPKGQQAGGRLPPHRRPARHRHRPGRGRQQAPHAGLLRPARRPGALPGPGAKGSDVNGPGAARRVLVCVMTPARRRGRPFDCARPAAAAQLHAAWRGEGMTGTRASGCPRPAVAGDGAATHPQPST